MTDITADELAKVNSFPRLVDFLRDKLEWPIPEDYGLEDVVFEYEPHELGLKDEDAAKLREIHQLRPLVTGQPWGIFFLSFENKAMSVTVLRRILRKLVVTKRGTSQSADRAAWLKEDLIFAANFGQSGERELAFVHFSDGASTGDLPVMKVLGWNARDTVLHNRHAAGLLSKQLGWPDDPADQNRWRGQWASAFEVGHREVITTSKELAVRLAALAGDIRARANQLLAAETDKGPTRTMLEAFRKNLIHDLDEDGFADMFAQTICYGMLAARISRPVGIIADNLADMVPKTNPFLKELFANFLHIGGRDKRQGMDFDELGVRDVVDMLNRANMEAVLRDFGDKNPKEDPVIHFYELFLKEYDPQKRMQRGVFYTPRPVVNFIVRGVDEILRTEFGLPLGLADTSTWAELAARNDRITIPDHVDPDAPFVQILDPATGTGTFLVEVIDLVHKRMVDTWNAEGKSAAEIKAAWNAYVPQHLLPRLTAFELMMAPYAIAHMNIGLKLVETGYTFGSDERAHVFLTNALEPAQDLDMQFDFMSTALAHEAKAANEAKDSASFTVVVGNPPYSVMSGNLSADARTLIDKFRYVDGIKIKERSMLRLEMHLQDDYVKFLALTQKIINKLGFGVSGLITNSTYLDSMSLRGARCSLSGSYSTVRIIDLGGNRLRTQAGVIDENVFEIEQGVAISLSSKLGNTKLIFFYTRLRGEMNEKLDDLATRTENDFEQVIEPSSPSYLFIPFNSENEDEWNDMISLEEIFPDNISGIVTAHDGFVVDFDRWVLKERFERIADPGLSVAAIREETGVRDNAGWKLAKAVSEFRTRAPKSNPLERYDYRPFDQRHIFYDTRMVWSDRRKLMTNMIQIENVALATVRQLARSPWEHVFVATSLQDDCFVSNRTRERSYHFPLWYSPKAGELCPRSTIDQKQARVFSEVTKLSYSDGIPRGQQGSLGKDFIQHKAEQMGLLDTPWDGRGDLVKSFGPRDLFDFIYAVLHASSYRSRYAEFLKSDFPRIPAPKDCATFADLVPLGRGLVALHLLKPEDAPVLKTPEIRFAGTGVARVEKGYPEYTNGKVMINASRWFEDVPKATWEFHVGGYQPCEKWLKDRAAKGGKKQSDGRVLTDDETLHYRRMVTALTETRRIMAEIDKVIESHGGWPGAFKVAAVEEVEPA